MKRIVIAFACLLAACGSRAPDPSPDDAADSSAPDAAESDGAAPDGAAPDGAAPDAAVHCGLRVDSIAPTSVDHATGGAFLLKGCDFTNVVDVEVSVGSVRFTIVNDGKIVAYAPPRTDGNATFPYNAEVDIIIRPSNQVQTWLVYQ